MLVKYICIRVSETTLAETLQYVRNLLYIGMFTGYLLLNKIIFLRINVLEDARMFEQYVCWRGRLGWCLALRWFKNGHMVFGDFIQR